MKNEHKIFGIGMGYYSDKTHGVCCYIYIHKCNMKYMYTYKIYQEVQQEDDEMELDVRTLIDEEIEIYVCKPT